MSTGFGADPKLDSARNVLNGTTAADIRKIFGALYSPGLVSGGVIKTSATNTGYNVAEGVGVFKMATGEHVVGYWPAQNVMSTSTVTPRTDYVYAYQSLPAEAGEAKIEVMVDTVLPTKQAVLLGTYTYKAGTTNSNAAVIAGSNDYAIPYGSTMGELSWDRDTLNGEFTTRKTIFSREITLPTDRLVAANFQTVVSSNVNAPGFNSNYYCEASYILTIDGVQAAKWQTTALTAAWATFYFEERRNLSAGSHRIEVSRGRETGPGVPYQHYGLAGTQGAILTITDMGVIR